MKNGKQEQEKEKAVEKGFEWDQKDDSPVGEARRSFYSGA
jgi:hypothetical protein